jgi:hypothetical protein
MRRSLLLVLTALLMIAPAFADPIVGSWKLNAAKSKFAPGHSLTAATRVYSESDGLYTLDEKGTTADGTEVATQVKYRAGFNVPRTQPDAADATLAHKIDDNTWDFELKKDGKVVGHVHRVVSADGKTLTVRNSAAAATTGGGDETLVFDKQ